MTTDFLPISNGYACAQTITAELFRLALAKMGVDWLAPEYISGVAENVVAEVAEGDLVRLSRHDQDVIQGVGERCVTLACEVWITTVAQMAFHEAGRGAEIRAIKQMARDAFADIHGKRSSGQGFPPPELIAHAVAAEYAAQGMFA